jgi:hypothetical protein
MNIRSMAMVLGAAFTVAAGSMTAIGCSSSNGGGSGTDFPGSSSGGKYQQGTGDDASTGTSSGDTTGSSSGDTTGSSSGDTTSSGASSSGTTASCKSAPSLHADPAGSIYCGFGAADGGSLTCGTGQQCCLGGKVGGAYEPQVCGTFGQACENPGPDAGSPAIPVQCAQVADCTANGIQNAACCLAGAEAPAPEGALPACASSGLKVSGGNSIMCEVSSSPAPASGAPACAAGEAQICSADSDCPTGQTCIPMRWKVIELGFCEPAGFDAGL